MNGFFFRGIAARGTLKPFFGQNVIDRSVPSSEEERGKKTRDYSDLLDCWFTVKRNHLIGRGLTSPPN